MVDQKRLKNLKLIVFDLDGTLLNDDGNIGEETLKLVPKLSKLGVSFSFASGRLHSALTDFAEQLDIHVPLISLDGAFIRSYPAGEVVSQTFIPRRKVEKAVAYGEFHLIKFALCHADAIYYTEHNAVIPDLVDKFGAKFVEVDSYRHLLDETLEILFISDMRDKLRYIRRQLSFPYTFGLITSYSKSVAMDGIYYLEVKRKGSTKASGLKKLIKHLGVHIKEAAVIGDWYNDLSLFETDALKVALDNAVMDLKEKADLVTKRNNANDGVAEFLELVLKAKQS